jgi:hypothetical protein
MFLDFLPEVFIELDTGRLAAHECNSSLEVFNFCGTAGEK